MIQDPLQAHLSTINMMANAIGKAKDFTSWINLEAYLLVTSLNIARDYWEHLPKGYVFPSIEEIQKRYRQCNHNDAAVDQGEPGSAIDDIDYTINQYFSETDQMLMEQLVENFEKKNIKRMQNTLAEIFGSEPTVNQTFINSYLAFLSDSTNKAPGAISTLCREIFLEGRSDYHYSLELSHCKIEKYHYPHLTFPYIRQALLEQWPLHLIHFRRHFPHTK